MEEIACQDAHVLAAKRAAAEFAADDCSPYEEVWRHALDGTLWGMGVPITSEERSKLEDRFVANAQEILKRLDDEIRMLQQKSSYLVATTALLFVVFGLQAKLAPSAVGQTIAVSSIALTGAALVAAVFPFAPPFWRAWAKPYLSSYYLSLLADSPLKSWAFANWLADRRTPVATRYKRAHAVAVSLLVLASVLTVAGLILRTLP